MPVRDFRFDTPNQKSSYVREMFDRIAPRYDLMNRIMTFGRDQAWRRRLVRRAGISANAVVLDIATGTGDIALVAQAAGARQVVAADFSRAMLGHARRKARNRRLYFAVADGLKLPFPDDTFDAVVTGFSLRNVANLDAFLREMVRVTKQGGKVASLEITRPRSRWFRSLFSWYFGAIVPRLGALISGAKEAYSYLPHSVSVFITPEELRVRLEDAGLHHARFETLMFGCISIHSGTKIRASTTARPPAASAARRPAVTSARG
ncbi:MAG: bifunctional demethylmenaquinone methyltransferase/2-methoxy-6-polyprenyl-1,4-benzoquinol methylase UbiE [candidate division KSB1 bacterium]|nr:bifunctional demethylmenaquinone methyltransferase/2-methoxy-6-polyprenyl-1,4-benzoquinol methylase UbiE [candidate division KSB1 bacterium]MDZ7276338.1 bifunctional demethylmenaquinone methyltransferase/2-methoxy-6-polyprenyl-1,4-benzoquinol methylase UbiE [candidate division KSB1 bacterium]MDZ7287709.1 bifunctional demethylmenaquinone methyltransferase/2-methoxy-6-polyprenyl-1,4-benzoquinol methylase UbiE [candidate division KSB1 bacterium]MDZ7299951.1 bifunctional demethylmenaquinone methy